MTAPLCVGCSGQCLYRSVVGCCHKKVSTATWQLFNLFQFQWAKWKEFANLLDQTHLYDRPWIGISPTKECCFQSGNRSYYLCFSRCPLTPSPRVSQHLCGPVPRVPPNPKSPDPLSQPPRNPKGVLAPTSS